ncbi:hypothetical protein [Pseudomonas serbica]|uniref:hypothetical protein n=1 Tax=Pseudomonas serbica TaxID=2965074 RepID=UPI00237AA8D2|nr:hypothetical protein [Pseudomonas serbica]
MRTRTSATLVTVISLGFMCLAQPALAETTKVSTMTSLDNLHGGNSQAVLIDMKARCTYAGALMPAEGRNNFKVEVERKSCPNDVGILVEEIHGTAFLGEFPIVEPCKDSVDCYRSLEAGAVVTLDYTSVANGNQE